MKADKPLKNAFKGIFEGRPFAGLTLVAEFIRRLKPVYDHSQASVFAEHLFRYCVYHKRRYNWDFALCRLMTMEMFREIESGGKLPTLEEIIDLKERLAAL